MAKLDFSLTKLIEEVQKRRLLYDTLDPQYRVKQAKEREWIDVCREVCKTNNEINDWDELSPIEKTDFMIEVKKKWGSLRDCFKRELRLYKKNSHNKKKYLFFDALLFLEPFCQFRAERDGSENISILEEQYKSEMDGNNDVTDAHNKLIKEEIFITDDNIKQESVSNDSDRFHEIPITEPEIECRVDMNNRIKVMSPEELSTGETSRNTYFVIDGNSVNSTYTRTFQRKRKRDVDNTSDLYEKNIKRKEYTEEMNEDNESIENVQSIDDDQAFLNSLLPTFKAMTTEQKFRLRIDIMHTILKFKKENKITK
ncbi:uncharacterized protein LOC106137923 [Amyelois transitella]|uniref:uncharacterized protein LOC106137923 n=1 Tax=Amyelois transitella TaxID=680683 RepID=UPI00298FA099|nr:uncharacterized protein LOC106137923 [Amyelois transitella]